MEINNRSKFAEVNEVSYKDKCVFVRSKIKEVINDIRKVVIPDVKSLLQDILEGRTKIDSPLPLDIDPYLTIHKLEYISDILKKWYSTISKNVDGEIMGNIFTGMSLFIQCEEDYVTTTVNSLYFFFNMFDSAHLNSNYTTYRFLSLCVCYCVCRYKFNRKIYCDNECKLLYYIRMISNCSTINEVRDIYRQAIKP